MTQTEINQKLDAAQAREDRVTQIYLELGCTIAHARVIEQERRSS